MFHPSDKVSHKFRCRSEMAHMIYPHNAVHLGPETKPEFLEVSLFVSVTQNFLFYTKPKVLVSTCCLFQVRGGSITYMAVKSSNFLRPHAYTHAGGLLRLMKHICSKMRRACFLPFFQPIFLLSLKEICFF